MKMADSYSSSDSATLTSKQPQSQPQPQPQRHPKRYAPLSKSPFVILNVEMKFTQSNKSHVSSSMRSHIINAEKTRNYRNEDGCNKLAHSRTACILAKLLMLPHFYYKQQVNMFNGNSMYKHTSPDAICTQIVILPILNCSTLVRTYAYTSMQS